MSKHQAVCREAGVWRNNLTDLHDLSLTLNTLIDGFIVFICLCLCVSMQRCGSPQVDMVKT